LKRFLSNLALHPWSWFFAYHVESVFSNQGGLYLIGEGVIPAYLVKKLSPFYASLLQSWIQLKGTRVGSEWVIPRSSIDSLPIDQVTARIGY
jgi:hypothetical protein